MSSPWKPPFHEYYKRAREASFSPEARSPEKAKEDFVSTFTREVREQQAALFAKVAKIEDQINRRFEALEEDFRAREDPTPKLEALRNAVVELQREDILGLTHELEEVNKKIEAYEKKMKEELQTYLDEKIKEAVEKICKKTLEQSTRNADSAETGIFITGVRKMHEAFKTGNNSDPCDVLHAALEKVAFLHTTRK